jgi:hypothetical protein
LLDSFGGQAVNNEASGTPPQSGFRWIRFRKFFHDYLSAWLLHVLVAILSSGRAAGGVSEFERECK